VTSEGGTAVVRREPADTPTSLGTTGWVAVAKRVKTRAKKDNVVLVAAGVAFFTFLAVPAALIAVISIWSLVADPQTLTDQISDLLSSAPDEVRTFFEQQLSSLSGSSSGGLAVGAVIGILAAIWTTSSAMSHLVSAINIAYGEDDSRGFVKARGLALALTGGAVIFGVIVIGLLAFLPAVVGDWASWARWTISVASFPIMLLAFIVGLAVLYRYAPDRQQSGWSWASWGAVIAALLWFVASLAFSFYARYFGSYNATYGALAGIVVLLLWLQISFAVVILGAEINAALEEHTGAPEATASNDEGGSEAGERAVFVTDNLPRGATAPKEQSSTTPPS
jgi:membrane protein